MKPYIDLEKYDGREDYREERLSKKYRKIASRRKKEERREKRKADKKALRDEWGF